MVSEATTKNYYWKLLLETVAGKSVTFHSIQEISSYYFYIFPCNFPHNLPYIPKPVYFSSSDGSSPKTTTPIAVTRSATPAKPLSLLSGV
jgi:hypothetical protein